MSNNSLNRIDHIDIARGIVMLLVVVGHSCSSTDGYLNRMILSFHMPLFFFLSGVFAKQGFDDRRAGTLLAYTINKTKRLLIPQILLGVTIIVLKGSVWVAHGNSLIDFSFLKCFGFWFLPTLWFCTIIYIILAYFLDLKSLLVKVSLLLFITGLLFLSLIYIYPDNGMITRYMRIIPVALLFYILGSFSKSKALTTPSDNERNAELKNTILLLSIPMLFIVSQWNMPVKMYMGEYGIFGLFLVTCVIGIYVVLEISKRLTHVSLLQWIGKASIAIYVWNFLIVGGSKIIIMRLLKMVGLYTAGVHASLTFMLSVVILFLICKVTLQYIPFVYGKDRKSTD